MEYGAGVVSDSDTKSAGDDVIVTSKSRLEVSGGVTLTSDSLSSSTSSSPSSRHHPGRRTSVLHDPPPEPVQTSMISAADKVLDMSVESSEVPLDVGCSVQSEHSRWDNVDEERHNGDDDDASSDYKSAVDLSTTKTLSTTDTDRENSDLVCRTSSENDLDEFPDTSRQRSSSLLQSKLVFSRPMSPVHT